MDIEAENAIKLFFPNPSLVMVYHEAIANALDAGATEISIGIAIQSYDNPSSLNITISDNGNGLNEENFGRFKTLLKPRDEYHKGIGKLLFLEYFNCVEVDSYWENRRRKFTYNEDFNGIAPVETRSEITPDGSKLVFSGFRKERIHSYDHLKPEVLKKQILDHFLPTLLGLQKNGIDFAITISLSTEMENAQKEFFSKDISITADDLPNMTKVEILDNTIDGIDPIDIYFHIEKTESKPVHLIAFSIDGRTIPAKLVQLTSIPSDYSVVFLFESALFNAKSDSARQKLVLPESIPEARLFKVLRRELGRILAENIPQISEANNAIQKQFEGTFPHLLGYFDSESVGLIERDEALNLAQQKFFKDQKRVLQSEHLSDEQYEKSLELSSRSLTEYVLYREKIIQKMKDTTGDNSEADLHNLIVPRFNEYSQDDLISGIYQNNAWLLDDKFMTFRTILSEGRMDKVINAINLTDEGTEESGRPDITMIFSADPETVAAVDVVVIEIKKKTDNEKDNQYVISQLLDRATKLAQYCPNIQRIWYYAIIQINDTMKRRLKQMKWAELFSKGQVFYQEYPTEKPGGGEIPTPVFILSFDTVVADAESRNHTFLEILRSSMKMYSEKMQGDDT